MKTPVDITFILPIIGLATGGAIALSLADAMGLALGALWALCLITAGLLERKPASSSSNDESVV